MNAMLLAAGRGTRLRSVEPDVPKVLVNIAGEPLLARQLRYLESQGISRVVVNVHHLADQVLAFADEYRGYLDLIVVVEKELLGTAGGVRNALSELGNDPFIVLYGDVLTNEPLPPLMDHHVQRDTVATLAVYESTDTDGKGTIEVDESDLVTGFNEKGMVMPGDVALINAGIYVLEPSFAASISKSSSPDFGHDVFPDALAREGQLGIYRLRTPVLDVGIPSTLELARQERGIEQQRITDNKDDGNDPPSRRHSG
jgi:NDP-sugar pyrophosphorylase family protein